MSRHELYRLFPDGFLELLRLAEIPEHPESARRRPLADSELIAEIHRVTTELERIPTKYKFNVCSKLSPETIRKRFGSWDEALLAYKIWLEQNEPTVSWLVTLQEKFRQPLVKDQSRNKSTNEHDDFDFISVPGQSVVYGELISFRGLQHAPLNENGVVYLFGMISRELGFLIEAVRPGYPDCHGKRQVKGNRWIPVRIEFEFQSRNFREHGHDPTQCDVIVCWEHNWSNCPIEVISLKEKIKTLKVTVE